MTRHIGVMVTDREFLDSHSRLGGVDGTFQLGTNHLARFLVMATDHRDQAGVQRTGHIFDVRFRRDSRGLSYTLISSGIDPDFRTDAGFVRRTDTWETNGSINYRWWPESWILNWGPRITFLRNYNYDGVLQDVGRGVGLNAQFAKNITVNAQITRDMERFDSINFLKTRYSVGGTVNTSRRISVGGSFNTGDQIRFVTDPFLGSSTDFNLDMTLRPLSRLQSQVSLDTRRFLDPKTGMEVFDVKIFRAVTTYQFTDRFLVRNIAEYNTLDRTLAGNLLLTYRVNAGTVFFVGYDDHYRQGRQIDTLVFPTDAWRRTNRAIFTKLQYLFRS